MGSRARRSRCIFEIGRVDQFVNLAILSYGEGEVARSMTANDVLLVPWLPIVSACRLPILSSLFSSSFSAPALPCFLASLRGRSA